MASRIAGGVDRGRGRVGAAGRWDHTEVVCVDDRTRCASGSVGDCGHAGMGDRGESGVVERPGRPVHMGYGCFPESHCHSRCHRGTDVLGQRFRFGLVHSGHRPAGARAVPTGLRRRLKRRLLRARCLPISATADAQSNAGLSGRDQPAAAGPKQLDIDLQHPSPLGQQ
ncbi:Uncharacterised protein [Mycobacteroides abscessus subsp. massiliense]|nr:Uncharacterised protein [Mycobacteroides abscessus subsp. massiliense]